MLPVVPLMSSAHGLPAENLYMIKPRRNSFISGEKKFLGTAGKHSHIFFNSKCMGTFSDSESTMHRFESIKLSKHE